MKNKQIFIGTIIGYLAIGIQIISILLITPFIIKSVGDHEYGIYRVITALTAYLSVFNFGLGNSLIKFLSEAKIRKELNKEKAIISFLFILNIVAICLVIILSLIIYFYLPYFFSKEFTSSDLTIAKNIFIILIGNVIATIINDIYNACLYIHERFIFSKTMETVRYILRMVLVLSVLQNLNSAIYVAFIDTFLAIFILLVNICYCYRKLKFHFFIKQKYLKTEHHLFYRNIVKYSLLYFFNLIIEQLIWNTDTVIIGMRLNAVEVAIFGAGSTISAAFSSMTQMVNTLFFPKVVKDITYHKNDTVYYTDTMMRIGRIQVFVTMFILTGYIIFGKTFVCNFWLGKNYEMAWSTSLISMIGILCSSLVSSGHLILRAIDKQTYFLTVYFFIFTVNAAVTYIIVEKYGIMGAAVATAMSYFIGMSAFIMPYYKLKIGIEIGGFLKNTVSIIIVYLTMGVIGYSFVERVEIRNIGRFILYAAIYVLLFFITAFFLFNSEEKNLIKNLKHK